MVCNYVAYMEYPVPAGQVKPDFHIDPEIAIELMLVSDFLDI